MTYTTPKYCCNGGKYPWPLHGVCAWLMIRSGHPGRGLFRTAADADSRTHWRLCD